MVLARGNELRRGGVTNDDASSQPKGLIPTNGSLCSVTKPQFRYRDGLDAGSVSMNHCFVYSLDVCLRRAMKSPLIRRRQL